MSKSFKVFYKQLKHYRKKEILKLFYDYIRKEKIENEKKRRNEKI